MRNERTICYLTDEQLVQLSSHRKLLNFSLQNFSLKNLWLSFLGSMSLSKYSQLRSKEKEYSLRKKEFFLVPRLSDIVLENF